MRAQVDLFINDKDRAGDERFLHDGSPTFDLSRSARLFLTGDDAVDLAYLRSVSNTALRLQAQIEARRAELNQPPLHPNDGPPQPGGWEAHDDPEVNQ